MMAMMMTTAEVAAWLKKNDEFLILTHKRPDGDTIGCAGALAQGLRECGKTAYVHKNPETTPRYLRLVEQYWMPEGYAPKCVVAVDTASVGLLHESSRKYVGSIMLSIDHHSSNTLFAERNCLDGGRAACGELVYEILLSMSGGISAATACRLYAAVSTDTGCFLYGNTTADTLRVASHLIELGAPHRELNRLLFREKSRGRMNIETAIYSGLEFHHGGAAAIASITLDMLKEAKAVEDDMDDIASLPTFIEGVSVSVTIREMGSPDDCRISVRTSPGFDAAKMCAHFGGGGHPMAAGATAKATVSEIKEEIVKILAGVFSR